MREPGNDDLFWIEEFWMQSAFRSGFEGAKPNRTVPARMHDLKIEPVNLKRPGKIGHRLPNFFFKR